MAWCGRCGRLQRLCSSASAPVASKPPSPQPSLAPPQVYNFNVPTFGKGVVYDVDQRVRSEQFRFVADALRTAKLRTYVPAFKQARGGAAGRGGSSEGGRGSGGTVRQRRCIDGRNCMAMKHWRRHAGRLNPYPRLPCGSLASCLPGGTTCSPGDTTRSDAATPYRPPLLPCCRRLRSTLPSGATRVWWTLCRPSPTSSSSPHPAPCWVS